MKRYPIIPVIIVICIMMSACSNLNITDSFPVNSEAEEMSELTKMLIDQRQDTAFESYLSAFNEANQWNSNVSLYEIPATQIVTNNLGLPAPGYYWFFMFSTENSLRELFIGISGGEIAGTFEAEPLLFDELPYELQPINIERLIDSDEALITCVENNLIIPQEIIDANLFIDYRLIDLGENPVWSLYRSDADPYLPVCNINAITKEVVSDPFEEFLLVE
jgi:hypothetical protein